MKKLLFIGIAGIWLFSVASAIDAETDACFACHQMLEDGMDPQDQITTGILDDIHIKRGLSCADCHGGDPQAFDDVEAAMWDNPTYLGAIPKEKQPEVCGSCHSDPTFMRNYAASPQTDQVSQYWISKHGLELKDGNLKVAACTDCHDVHGIRSPSDPLSTVYPTNLPQTCSHCHSDADYMAEFGIPTDQFIDYKQSVHGQALFDQGDISAPVCNDCHGNHGAIPPEVGHISDICGTCHINNMKLFQESHLQSIFLDRGLQQCESCHGNHKILKPNDEFLHWADESVCKQCHEDGGDAKQMSLEFYEVIDSLKTGIHKAEVRINDAEQKGMVVSDLLFKLEEAHNVLIKTRTSIHSFNKEFVEKTAQPGFEATQAALAGSEQVLGEYSYRRKGLFVFSLIITFVVIMLYLKIRTYNNSKD